MSSTVTSVGIASEERRGAALSFLDRWLFPVALVGLAIAFLPVLLVYLSQLWVREYYRFFPFAFAATLGLAWNRMAARPNADVSVSRWVLRAIVFVVAQLLLVGGIMLGSVWPCYVAFVAMLGLVLDFWNEADCPRSLAYLLFPMVLTVRAPLGLDQTAVQELQGVTSKIASAFLSMIHVDHLLAGNIIQPLIGGELLVDEACSGVQSLYTLMFIAAFMGVYRRYTLLRTSVLVGSAVFWALMMNVFRVSAIAIAQTQFQTDLATGWKHEAVGYAGILLAIGFLISTDRLIFFGVSGIPDDVQFHPSPNVFVVAWNWLFVAPDLAESDGAVSPQNSKAASPAITAKPYQRPLVPILAAVLGVSLISGVAAWPLVKPASSGAAAATVGVSIPVASDWLPVEAFPNCKLLQYDTERRQNSPFGDFSEQWTVATPVGNVRHSIDHPFFEFHDLTVCYRNIGWQLTNVQLKSSDTDEQPWPVIVAEFVRPTAERAVVCFSSFTQGGKGINGFGQSENLFEQRRNLRFSGSTDPVVQVQTLYQSIVPPGKEVIEQLVAYHRTARVELRDRVVEQVSKPAAPIAVLPSATDQGGQP